MNKPSTWNNGDFCLRESLFCTAKTMSLKRVTQPGVLATGVWPYSKRMNTMEKECRLNTWHFLTCRKSDEYKWSSSDGATRWIYDVLLKHLNIDPYKLLNLDQLRAYLLYVYETGNRAAALKVLLGYLLRCGFSPSMTDGCWLRMGALVLAFKTIWGPLQYLTWPWYVAQERINLAKPITSTPDKKGNTTGKIVLLMTMRALGRKMPSAEYVNLVYDTYFPSEKDKKTGEEIGLVWLAKACKEALK